MSDRAAAAIVFGGYGVFGSQVCRELVRRGQAVSVAGRDGGRAEAFARALGERARGLAADLSDAHSCRRALEGHAVAVNCAGPFTPPATRLLLEACLQAGCHYADIADDRSSLEVVRGYGIAFAAGGRCALHGCSSLPGLSLPLALGAATRGPAPPPRRARVTLFIGNDHPKGGASISSMVGQLGRPIAAPQGELRGWRGCERVVLPPPLGARRACDFDGPEHDLLPPLLGVREVRVKVAFELTLATRALSLMAAAGPRWGARTARWLTRLGSWTRGFGSSSGVVMAELFWDGEESRRASLVATRDAQRMAALPCALAVDALMRGRHHPGGGPAPHGALLAHELLGVSGLLDALQAEGFALVED